MFGAFADRFVELQRNPTYDYARRAHTRGALTPGSVFSDADAWTGASGPVRLLETEGTRQGPRYVMASRPNVAAPSRLGDARHVTTLSRLSNDEYRWDTAVDFALGNARPADIALAITRLIASAEGRTEAQARADVAAAAPRTSAALGHLFSLDSLRPVLLADGTTSVVMGIGMHSDILARRYPALGDYARRYVDPARYHMTLKDRAGAVYVDAVARDERLTIRTRVHRGRLVPLTGAPRPIPDTLQMELDVAVKVKIFTVGFHDLRMQFVNSARGDAERAWAVTAREEPKWDLPLITARLLRAPLRRPFAGEGALFRLGVREGTGGAPTVLVRQARLTVQESPILRFLNSLSSSVMDDLEGKTEREQNLFMNEIFSGLKADAAAAIP